MGYECVGERVSNRGMDGWMDGGREGRVGVAAAAAASKA